jgi:integrase/recombinase XerD
MTNIIYSDSATQARLELGPFEPYLDDFIAELKAGKFPESYIKRAFRVILRLSDWVGLKQIPIGGLTSERIGEFWDFHGIHYKEHRDHRLCKHFFNFLRHRCLIPDVLPPVAVGPIEETILEFKTFLCEEKGHSAMYIYQLTRATRLFLTTIFSKTDPVLDQITSQVIADYLTDLLRTKGSGETKDNARHLVQFFKFLFIKGKIRSDLSKVVPKPAIWRHTRMPIYINPDQVKKLLESCDRQTQIGARDFAILMLLSRLGLRACEVKNLNLEDVQWHDGAIVVRGKGKESRMPLPAEVGDAIAIYVKDFRPSTTSRSVFVSVFAPFRGLQRSNSVGGIVRFALQRAGIDSPLKGSHLLRHTVANECLKSGARLDEVARLLRHEQLSTAAIYAKVDFERLSSAMRPWQGGVK